MAREVFVIDAEEVMPYSLPGGEDTYASQCIIDLEGARSEYLQLNRSRLMAGKSLGGGTHAPDHDECYYVLSGRGRLLVGGDPDTLAGSTVIELRPDSVVFIPGGVFHAVQNPYDADFVFLTIWPNRPRPGDNGIYDGRLRDWGTAFRLRERDN